MNAPFYTHGLFGDDTSLVFAFFIGIAFGFFLERGGLGNATKLVGQFYLRDLTVFKMMFSAIITAMIGLITLSWLGLVDMAQVYVSPTYIVPQTIGGLIFGAGFVMGGYCPGTSCVAASTGRIDGIVNVFGMIAGILVFGESFSLFEGFYYSTPMGQVTFPELFHLPEVLVVAAVVLMATGGFIVSERIEKRASRR